MKLTVWQRVKKAAPDTLAAILILAAMLFMAVVPFLHALDKVAEGVK